VLDQRPGVLRRERKLVAPLLAELRLHRLEQLFFGLRAEAMQAAQASVPRRAMQLLRRMHLELAVERLHLLRPQPRDAQQLGNAGRRALAQLLAQLAGAAGRDLAHLRRQVVADSRQLRQRPAFGQLRGDVEPQAADQARRVAVGAHAERVAALELEQIGDFVEHARNVGVVNGHVRIIAHCRRRATVDAPAANCVTRAC